MLLGCLLLVACNKGLPTEPSIEAHDANVIATACTGAASLDSPALVLKTGSTYDATVRVCFPPAVLPWTFSVGPPGVAEGRASIAAGQSSATLRFTAISPGKAAVSYVVPRFGHAPSTAKIADVLVVNSLRRSSVSH